MSRWTTAISIVILYFVCCISPTESVKCRVLVVGTGPAGLLASHCLLSRASKQYDINIIESREDPRKVEAGPRAYSLGLNIRGQTAVEYFDEPSRSTGLWDEIMSKGVATDSFFLHIFGRKFQIRKPAAKTDTDVKSTNPPPTILLARNKLSEAMLDVIERVYGQSGKLKIEFNSRLQSVNLEKRTAVVDGKEREYDLLIGADGVQSVVRQAVATSSTDNPSSDGSFETEEVVLPGKFKVFQQKMPDLLESDAIHAIENGKKGGYGLFLIPAPDNNTCVLLNWKGAIDPLPIWTNVTVEDIQLHIEANYPMFGKPTPEAISLLQQQEPSVSRTVRCNRYHDTEGSHPHDSMSMPHYDDGLPANKYIFHIQ